MKRIYDLLGLIHGTPMIKLKMGIFAKAEFLNPSGSIKDRMALYMIERAEKKGKIKPGDTLVEATTGNTGIAFSMIAKAKGYRFLAVMPEGMSIERVKLIKALGGEVEFVRHGALEAVKMAKKLAKEKGYVFLDQFSNPDNPASHRKFTGKEIWKELNGNIDVFVAGVGTGGTLIGVAKYLKKKKPEIKAIAVEPAASPLLSGGKPGKHIIQGIGEDFVPKIIQKNKELIDEIIQVTDEDALKMTKRLMAEEGLLVGISSGANVWAALELTKKYNGNIVTVLPDSAQRYLSMKELFGD